jgi:diguanylate cyclase (GGDEF)-like protein
MDPMDDAGVLPPMTMTAGVDVSLDTALVQAALVGRDVLAPAMQVLRAHLGNSGLGAQAAEHVVFVPAEAGEPTGGVRAEVRHRERIFGWLAGPLTLPVLLLPVLQNQADWLACWLALSHQQLELRRAALVDDLTGAWNRRYFERFLQAAIERAQGQRHTLSVLVIDIDNFKYFNDRFGHAAGDEILKETVRLLKSVIRSGDRVCRIGGDELAVVFYEPSGPRESGSKPLESIEQITARFQKQIAEARFPKLGPQAPGKLTVSGGLATYPWDGRTVAELVAHADDLAMSTKRAGKNKITFGPHAGEEAPGTEGA